MSPASYRAAPPRVGNPYFTHALGLSANRVGQWATLIEEGRQKIDQALAVLNEKTGTGEPTGEPTDGSTGEPTDGATSATAAPSP